MLLPTPRTVAAVAATLFFSNASQPGHGAPTRYGNSGTRLTTRQVITRASRSVVSLSVYGQDGQVFATGSGFVVGKNMIATNLHVVFGAHAVNANFPDGHSEPVPDALEWDAAHDLIILLANTHGLPALSLGVLPAVGDNVIAIGSPKELNNSVSTGIVSGIRMQDGTRVIQTTAPISHGSSGGPLLSDTGRVLGVTSSSLTDGQNLNFAVSANYLPKIIPARVKRLISWRDLEENKWWRTNPDAADTASAQASSDKNDSDGVDAQTKQRLDDANTAIALGDAFADKGQNDQAAAQYRKAIQTYPEGSVAHLDLGNILYDMGKLDQALDEYKKSAKNDPENPDVHDRLASLYSDIKLYDKSIAEADTAIKLDPKYADAYFQKGFSLIHQEKPEDAELAFRNAIRWDDQMVVAYNNLGLVLILLNRRVEARQQWTKVLTMGDAKEAKQAQKFLDDYPEKEK